MSEHLFENRKKWYKHETQYHRLDWSCNTYDHPDFQSQIHFIEHMTTSHGAHLDEKKLITLRSVFQKPSKMRSGECNLCGVSAERLGTHVAHHLQQISLFALPRANDTQGSGGAEFDTQSSRLRGNKQEQSHDISWQSRSVSPTSVNEERNINKAEETQVRSETVEKLLHKTKGRLGEMVAHIDESILLPMLEEINETEQFLLLDQLEAKLESTKDFYSVALQTASKAGFVGVAQFLLERGRADVNKTTDLGFTPLMMAAEAGHLSTLQLLISQGADVNIRNKWNTTALMMAAKRGHEAVVRLLLEHNAEVDSSDDTNDAKLSKGGDVNIRNSLKKTALMMAMRAGHDSVVRLLLEHNAGVDSSDDTNDPKLKSGLKVEPLAWPLPPTVKISPTHK